MTPRPSLVDASRARFAQLREAFGVVGRGLPISLGLILLIAIGAGVVAFAFLNSAPPTTLTMTSGPPGRTAPLWQPASRAAAATSASSTKLRNFDRIASMSTFTCPPVTE